MSSVVPTTIICLANSIKHGAYCVAGIEPSTGRWIRPVSSLDDGRIERSVRLIKGLAPRLGDIISIPLGTSGPDFGFECENLSLLPGQWSRLGAVSSKDLLAYCSPDKHILHNADSYVTISYLQSLPFAQRRTLQLAEVFDFKVFSNGLSPSGGHKWKASFRSKSGGQLTARITDPAFLEKLETGYCPGSHCLVTVSLSMPYRGEDWEGEDTPCWKLVAGVIEMQDSGMTIAIKRPSENHNEAGCAGKINQPNTIGIDDNAVMGILRKAFGFSSFRPNQQDITSAILDRRDVMAVMPTGGGKSLCYQLPAFALPGTCLVISPLIALMKDQVDAAQDFGLRAAFFNSTLTDTERVSVFKQLYEGKLDLLYVSPERFAMEKFLNALKRVTVSFVAIDEAHCISEWGHDFRPDYLYLSEVIKHLPHAPIAAFTATATQQVQDDICARLGLRRPLIVRASFDRANLFYQVTPKDDPDAQIVGFLRQHPGESGIIYRATRKSVDATAAMLQANGIKALPYHAGLDDSTRQANQEAFDRDEIKIIVATIAFGMGIDKPDIRFVIHGDLPKNIESYYQETGRAGRDGEKAHCLLLFGRGDIPKIRYFIDQVNNNTERQRLNASLERMVAYAGANTCRRRMLLAYFGETYPHENCSACDMCSGKGESVDATVDAQKILAAILQTEERFGIGHIVDILRGANTQKIRQFSHTNLKAYGIGKDKGKNYWQVLIHELIAQEYLAQSEGKYPVLALSEKGRSILTGEARLFIMRDKEIAIAMKPLEAGVTPYAAGLFEELRALRYRLAQEQSMPPYIIFPDRSLREMATTLPTTLQDMLAINGVGETKMARYGDVFMEAILSYVNRHPPVAHSSPGPVKPEAAPIVRIQPKSETIEATWELVKKGLGIDAIAVQRSLARSTIYSHLERLILEGREIKIDTYVPYDHRVLIKGFFSRLNSQSLKDVVEASKGTVGYEEARLVRAWMKAH